MPELTIATFNCAGMANPILRPISQTPRTGNTCTRNTQQNRTGSRMGTKSSSFQLNKKTATPKNGVAIFLNDPNIKAGMTKRDWKAEC